MSDENRHLAPTARRRQGARQAGHVVASSHVTGAAVWLSVLVLALLVGEACLTHVVQLVREIWRVPWSFGSVSDLAGTSPGGPNVPSDSLPVMQGLQEALSRVLSIVLPMVGVCFVAAMVGRIVQIGFLWVPERIAPDLNRLASTHRVQHMFCADRIVDALKLTGFLVALIAVAGWMLWNDSEKIFALFGTHSAPRHLMQLCFDYAFKLGFVLAAFAAVDYVVERYRFERQLAMSPEELQAEIKAISANPAVVGSRRQFQQQLRN